jgi:hypothetical protein
MSPTLPVWCLVPTDILPKHLILKEPSETGYHLGTQWNSVFNNMENNTIVSVKYRNNGIVFIINTVGLTVLVIFILPSWVTKSDVFYKDSNTV